jgi:hypothetical protein
VNDGCEANLNTDNGNCGGCGNVCNANTCGGSGQNVATASCSGGACGISACAGNWQDTDGQCFDGCECGLSTVTTTCPQGAYNLGSLPVGGQPVSHTSNLFPASPNAAYYVVTFSGNTITSFHPRITLTDPLGEFVMEVSSDCTTLISNCTQFGDTLTSSGITTWEVQYTGGDTASYPLTGSHFQAIPPVGNGGTVYVKVYRKVGWTKCNNAYTITASG